MNYKAIIFTLSISFLSIHASYQAPSQETQSVAQALKDTWTWMTNLLNPNSSTQKLSLDARQQELLQQGPLSLGFMPIKRDNLGRILGWLTIPEFKSAIYIRVDFYNTGYSISYMCPENYSPLHVQKQLPTGLYYWKSTEKVQTIPTSPTFYLGSDKSYVQGSEHASWHPNSSWTIKKDLYKLNSYESWDLEDLKLVYINLPSLSKLFKGTYSTFVAKIQAQTKKYINQPNQATSFKKFWQTTYPAATAEQRSFLLSTIAKDWIEVIRDWIGKKLSYSNMKDSEMLEIEDQYMYEKLSMFLRWNPVISINDFLDDIANFDYCSADMRKEMHEAFAKMGRNDIYGQMTGKGKITCNPGLRVQD